MTAVRKFVLDGDGGVSLPSHLLDTLASLIRRVGADVYYQSTMKLVDQLGDGESVFLSTALEERQMTPQEFFDRFADVLPHYFPLLKSQLSTFNYEVGISEKHVSEYIDLQRLLNEGCQPELNRGPNGRYFTLLQVAGCQAGISPEMHRYWYVMLAMLTQSMFEETITQVEEAWLH